LVRSSPTWPHAFVQRSCRKVSTHWRCFSIVGAQSSVWVLGCARCFSTLEDLEAHYTEVRPMSRSTTCGISIGGNASRNDVRRRWRRGTGPLLTAFAQRSFQLRRRHGSVAAPLLRTEVSETLGRAVHDCDNSAPPPLRAEWHTTTANRMPNDANVLARQTEPAKASHFSLSTR